jgi:acetoin utilization deacetylase AcuC-like enzyme
VGGVFSLLDEIWRHRARRGFAAIRPPGHHAEPDRAMGFCLFNNIALGACYLQHAYGVKKIMIVDIDAHHGNGTQTAFYDSNSVLYFSMHQFPCYPGTGNFGETGSGAGEGYSVNVPLAKGLGDREFVQVIHFLVTPLACAFEPEIMLISCGFDLYRHDRLAGMQGTPEGYAMITRLLQQTADTVCGGKIAFIMEGGYSIQGIRECGLMVIKEMCALSGLKEDRLDNYKSDSPTRLSSLRKSIEIQKKYWKIFV